MNFWPIWRIRALVWDFMCKRDFHFWEGTKILGEPVYRSGCITTNYVTTCSRCGKSKHFTTKVYEFSR